MAAAVRLFWKRDSAGYEIEARKDDTYIVPVGGEISTFMLEGQYWRERTDKRRLFEHFVNADPTPEGARAFANEWGFLLRRQTDAGCMDLSGEYGFARLVKHFDQLLILAHRKDYKALRQSIVSNDDLFRNPQGIGHFTLDVAPVPGAELPHVFIRAQSLISFAVMELMQAIAGTALSSCASCHNFFMARGNGVYCSSRCRLAKHRARRKEEEGEQNAAAAARPKEPRTEKPTPAAVPVGRRRRRQAEE